MDTWRSDLERAGIPFLDGEGRRFDFHALRHTLCTHLRDARVGLRDAMAIMRHSDPRLTMRVYTDERQIGVASEVAKLPDLGTRTLVYCGNTSTNVQS
jgi:integrase